MRAGVFEDLRCRWQKKRHFRAPEMRYSKALRPLSVAETLTAAVCLIALPTVTEQQTQSQQQLHQLWKREESSVFEIVHGACNSMTTARRAAGSRTASERDICCRKIGYRFFFHPSASQSTANRLSDYRCCNNDSGWGAVYHPEEALCCGGKVVTRRLSGDLKCCNGEALYNASTHTCCVDDGLSSNEWQIHPKPSFAELHHHCCGKELYNNLTSICCSSVDGLDNRVHPLPHEEAQEIVPKVTACCGTAIYKTTSDLVCRGDDLIDEAKLCAQSQGSKWHNDSHICCSGNMASKTSHICCEGVLHEVSDGRRCCGSHYVNENEYLCCNGTAYPQHNNAQDMACCGSKVFNQNTHRCHVNQVLRNYFGTQAVRCGDGDKASFINPLVHVCCNGLGYHKERNLCCNGKQYNRSDLKIESCCGSQKYDTATQSCIESHEVRHGAEAVVECQSVRYDPREHICCADRLLLRKNGNKCCGNRNYFETSWLRCCNGKTPRLSHKRSCQRLAQYFT